MTAEIKSHNIPLDSSSGSSGTIQTPYINIVALHPTDPSTTLPTTLLLPFWGGNASTYDSVLSTLAQQQSSSPTIALSYRGTGTSPAPAPDTPEAHHIPALAADVLQVLRHAAVQDLMPSRKLVLCAHSMSTKVAWELMHLLGTTALGITVVGVLLLAPAPPGPFELPPEMRAQQVEAYQGIESAEWVVRNVLTASKLDEEVYARLARDCVGMSEGAKRGWVEAGMQWDCRELLEQLVTRPPVRVLAGEDDKIETTGRVVAETVEVLRASRFQAGVRIVEGRGHLLPVEATQEVAEEIKKLVGYKSKEAS